MKRILTGSISALLLALVCQGAMAQWVWKDDQGHTVFSDQPPPAGIPPARIVRTPSGRSNAPISGTPGGPGTAPTEDDGSASSANRPKSLAEQDLEYKKRQKDAAEASKKQAETAAADKVKQQNCSDAKRNMANLQSGARIQTVDADGNRAYMDDAQRAEATARSQQALAGC